MEKAVVYTRVSSKEQEDTGYSLDAQEKLLKSYAEKQNLSVVRHFRISESASGQKQRVVFTEMMKYMTKEKINVLICEKVDRLTRNFKDAIVIDDWLEENEARQVHLVRDSLTLRKDSRSQEKLNWGVRLLFAKNYTDNLSEEVKKGQAAKLAAGHLPTKPPLGYRTVGEQGKKVHVVDEETAPLVRKMFEMYATGNYSVIELTRRLNEMGLRNRNGNKVSKSRVHDFLTNPFYYGEIMWKGEMYAGVHEPLVSFELFNEVQTKLNRKIISPYYRKHPMRYRGKIKCHECGRTVSWERQKGKLYGACKNCKQQLGETGKYITEEELDVLVVNKILEVAPKNKKVVDVLNRALKEDATSEIEVYEAKKKKLNDTLARGDQRLDIAYTDRLDGRIAAERYDSLKREWDIERKSLLAELQKLSDDKSAYYEAGFSVHVLAERAQTIYQSEKVSDEDRKLLLSYAFSSISLKQGQLTVEYTKAFEFLEKWVPPINQSFEPLKSGSIKRQKAASAASCPELLRGQDSNLRPIGYT